MRTGARILAVEGANYGQPRQTRPREEKAKEKAKENATQTGQQASETGDRRETGGATSAAANL
jgi:hypothetical protein